MTITDLRWVSKPKAASEVFAAKDVRMIANHLGIDIKRVTDEAHFTDLGADWLDRLDLMIVIEERFDDVEISDTDIDQIDVVGDLIRHIETLRWNADTSNLRRAAPLTRGAATLGKAGVRLTLLVNGARRERLTSRILNLAVLALTGFLGLMLSGHLWGRYARETTALGFGGIYERFQASQAGFANDPIAYRAAA
jgi:acyl carrier protein